MDITTVSRQNSLPTPREDSSPPADPQSNKSSSGATTATAANSTPKTYESPVVRIDSATGSAVLSFVDPSTGKQSFQVPSRTALEYERQQHLTDATAKAAGDTTSA